MILLKPLHRSSKSPKSADQWSLTSSTAALKNENILSLAFSPFADEGLVDVKAYKEDGSWQVQVGFGYKYISSRFHHNPF